MKTKTKSWYQLLLKTTTAAILALLMFLSSSLVNHQSDALAGSRKSMLAQGDAITDPLAILRYALPIDNDTVRKIQADLEDISNQLRGKRWGTISRDVKDAKNLLNYRREQLLASIPEERQSQASALLEQINTGISKLESELEAKDKNAISETRAEILNQIGQLEALMVTGFPFAIPEEYTNLPQLLGRATVEITTTKGDLTIVVDGYSAPINGGNFVDLVQRGFYDGLNFIRAEDFYVLQAGDPPGEEEGFIDPKTNQYRAIPLEVLVKNDPEPVYGVTLEELGRYLDQPVLPFNAYGAVALARPANDPNGGSSQFFFFKFDTELTPPGYNLMDGRYSVFGYVVKGKEVLEELTADDKIISAKVIDGLDNLVQPKAG
ncbi:peptidyl-prolyl cis-trans isomerase cyclophilin type [Stanieria cyanosphaera PCC 7437]|uniref:peptidylprolyl isomerase n=1 Tax=Stanieria cyanosphaera (strain ATCC 29371 / PCC 7437) TaxID=111780 RepID=K9Y016_STAC7|nr:peptidylprolyl isomerase [Stanieria cyanosphaera]AFZ37629.1 peptidyl-prolyl cis-trans isomerase cyclophilin type [Stanieria cyanosphaera PCC 7437]